MGSSPHRKKGVNVSLWKATALLKVRPQILGLPIKMASTRQRANKICYLMEGDIRREEKEDISHTIEDHFTALYKKEDGRDRF